MIDNYEVIKKLIGPIEPIGESQTDAKRLENLKSMCELVSCLLNDIYGAAYYRGRYESSMKEIGNYAQNFIDNTKKHMD